MCTNGKRKIPQAGFGLRISAELLVRIYLSSQEIQGIQFDEN
jgi:hypothetical protein